MSAFRRSARARPPAEDPASGKARRRASLRIIARVAPYLWPADAPWVRRRVVAALILLALAKVATVATPFFYKAAVDALAPAPDAPQAVGFALAVGPIGLVAAYAMARLMGVGFAQLRDALFARVAQRALRRMALETFSHIHALSLRYHVSRRTGGLSRIIERGVKGVEFLLRFLVFSIGPLALELAMVAAVFAVELDLRYFLVVAATIALYVWFTFAVTEWRVKIRAEMNRQDASASQKALDSLLNYETVKYFNAERREAARYDRSMAAYEGAAVRTGVSLAFLNLGQSLIITAGLGVVMAMAAQGVMEGRLTVGDFVMVNAFIIQITMPLNFLGTVYREIRQALTDMSDMFELLDQPPEIVDRPGAPDLKVTRGEVAFEDVRFGYEPDRPILKGVSLRAEGGRTLAVVGPTGSGKSTLGRLLYRFYDVQGGRVTIDGQDVREVAQDSLRRAIGVVPQDTVLFNDTIGYNIGYGKEGATQAEIEEAARAAQIHDFIASLPQGYETMVGERGLKLSGGEKQRVAIARAILKNPPILILDEATSALDTETERQIQDSLRRLSRGRTVLVVAHRLSTVVDADRIVVLENGEVVESGTHAELLARGGRYAQLWKRQESGEGEGEGDAEAAPADEAR
ncbi:ABCB family ABC transporter ATP-binding protein/permease [Oceanicella actignis]|uniref:ABCB family ABC transporter ATP-binding protein/permease n=1 Tax=Oceanicella actignis TaxID=1189325 RepID=UPI0011E824E7|nr:ABC transporter ATP-binding protein/permease [Oceanicella actignis]TYO89938.1 ATP-binding cassette subfamily B protein [Oceanicella actignis]